MRHTQNIRKTFARLEYTNKDMHKDTDKKLILWRFVYKNNVFSWETEKGKPSVTHSTIFLLLLRRFKKKTMHKLPGPNIPVLNLNVVHGKT